MLQNLELGLGFFFYLIRKKRISAPMAFSLSLPFTLRDQAVNPSAPSPNPLRCFLPKKAGRGGGKSTLISTGKWTFSVSNKSNTQHRRSSSLIRDVYWRLCLSSCQDEKKL